MLFWGVCLGMTAIVFAMVFAPLWTTKKTENQSPSVAFYKAQLAEIDNDVARGILVKAEASRTHTEIARRLLSAAHRQEKTSPAPPAWPVTAIASVIGVAIALSVYSTIGAPGASDMPLQPRLAAAKAARENRPSQLAAQASARDLAPPDAPADYLASVDRLRSLMTGRPQDVQGWELLAYHEARLQNFPAAADAQDKLIAAKGSAATPDDLLRHVEFLVAAADGYVSPEAEAQVLDALSQRPGSIAGRYYLGAMYDQTGRPDLAFQLWRQILDHGEDESLYSMLARSRIERAAYFAGVSYTPPARVQTVELRGPNREQMNAAEEMDPEARQQMIEGMVSSLADRLAEGGGTVEEWARLITAYGVLNRTEEARGTYQRAIDAFSTDPEAVRSITEAACRASVETEESC